MQNDVNSTYIQKPRSKYYVKRHENEKTAIITLNITSHVPTK